MVTDIVFSYDAIILPEPVEVPVLALKVMEEAKSLGLQISWVKTKVQVFRSLLDEAVVSVPASGEGIEILESFTYLGNLVHNSGGS